MNKSNIKKGICFKCREKQTYKIKLCNGCFKEFCLGLGILSFFIILVLILPRNSTIYHEQNGISIVCYQQNNKIWSNNLDNCIQTIKENFGDTAVGTLSYTCGNVSCTGSR